MIGRFVGILVVLMVGLTGSPVSAQQADNQPQAAPQTAAAPAKTQPQATVQAAPQATVQAAPQATVQAAPQATVTQTVTIPQAPVQYQTFSAPVVQAAPTVQYAPVVTTQFGAPPIVGHAKAGLGKCLTCLLPTKTQTLSLAPVTQTVQAPVTQTVQTVSYQTIQVPVVQTQTIQTQTITQAVPVTLKVKMGHKHLRSTGTLVGY